MHDATMSKIYRNIAIIFIIIIVMTLTIFLGVIPAIKYSERPAFLDILVSPVSASISIDGIEYQNAVYAMEPGQYTATISQDGFKPVTVELNLQKDQTTGLYLYLEPTNGDWSYYQQEKNQASLEAFLRLNGYNFDGELWQPALNLVQENSDAQKIANQFAVKSLMPMDFSSCTAPASRMTCNAVSVEYDYSEKCDNYLCLVITGRSPELPANILSDIKKDFSDKGYNFDDYQYIYTQDTTK